LKPSIGCCNGKSDAPNKREKLGIAFHHTVGALRAALACGFGGLLRTIGERFLAATRWRRGRSAAPPIYFAPGDKGCQREMGMIFFIG